MYIPIIYISTIIHTLLRLRFVLIQRHEPSAHSVHCLINQTAYFGLILADRTLPTTNWCVNVILDVLRWLICNDIIEFCWNLNKQELSNYKPVKITGDLNDILGSNLSILWVLWILVK